MIDAVALAVQLLIADEAVNEAVSGRVFGVEAPQSFSVPALVVSLIYEGQDVTLTGSGEGFDSRLSVQQVATTAAAAGSLGELVKVAFAAIVNRVVADDDSPPTALAKVQSVLKDGSDIYDSDPARTLFHRVTDYRMRWNR